MKNFITIILLCLFIYSCEHKTINEQTPYAIKIKELRSFHKAEAVMERVNGMGIDAYIIARESTDGVWYSVLSGGEASLDELELIQKSIESKGDFPDLEVVDHKEIKDELIINYEEKVKEKKRISSAKPGLPSKIFDLINKFPDDQSFLVKSFLIVNSPDSVKDINKFSAAMIAPNDLPRGVTIEDLLKRSEAMAEVVYEDNIFGDQVTIDIVKLRKEHGIKLPRQEVKSSIVPESDNGLQLAMANYFAELVLATGKYSYEDKSAISVESYQLFSGYNVTIQPGANKSERRTYLILVSEDLKHLVFSQSTKKTQKEILDLIEHLGRGEGLDAYDEFYNAFYTLPLQIEDEFICFFTEKLTDRYAQQRNYAEWSKKMVGHWVTTASFYGDEKKSWSSSLFDLLHEGEVDYIYNDLYIQSHKSSTMSYEIEVLGKTGISFKGSYPSELSFPGGRYVVTVNNQRYGRLSIDDMLTVASSLQLES